MIQPMTHLSLALLGPIHGTLAGQAITPFKYDKVGALLVYLAVESDRAHEREGLMGLLWPDLPEEAARNNLRQALVKLRDAIGDRTADPPFLLTSRATLQFDRASDYQVDVAVFTGLLDACDHHVHRHPESCKTCTQQLQQAVDLYQGPFLAEFFLPDSAAFEEWALVKREGLHRRMVDALGRLVRYHERCSHYPQALLYAQRQLTLEPWAEEVHRQLMRLHLLNGDRNAALAQYESCRRILAAELDVPPEAATVALYTQIRNADNQPSLALDRLALPTTRPHDLPVQLTPFLGREPELAELSRLLDRPECRVLTITGPGGIGKTRLALQSAAEHVDDFADGVFFVPLVGVTIAHFLPHAILAALGVPLQAQPPADEQLRTFLQKQEVLLVLDNYEQLLPDVKLLLDLLRAAPAVVLLVTSRERLALQAEWLFALDGLSYPPVDAAQAEADEPTGEPADEYEAVQLFIQRVQQTQRAFLPTGAEHQAVRRICQLVEGMPLALELAAAVVREQSCAAIVVALEQGHLPASTRLRDRPDRHHSMTAVFEQSWRLLSAAEQRVLRALSVFRGGFLAEAAQAVAGATPPILAALVDKSLLRRNRAGRYDLHELVRQYANQQLAECGEFAVIQKGYIQYFLRFTDEVKSGIEGTQPIKWMTQVEQEIDNLRSVLKWLTLYTPEDGLRMILDLFIFWQSSGHFQEGYDWFIFALAHSASVSPQIRASAYSEAGFITICMNKITEAEDLFAQSLLLYQQLDATDLHIAKGVALALNRQSLGPLFRGDYQQAVQLCRQSLAVAQQIGDQWRVSSSLYFTGEALYLQGLFAQSKRSYEESLILCEAVGNVRSNALRLVRLGHVACAQGDFVQSITLFKKGLMVVMECHDLVGIGMALIGLARMAAISGHYQRATMLLAAKEKMTAINPIVRFWPMDRKENERTLTILHAHLDDATFAAAWAAGCALSLEQATAYALADETEIPGSN